MYLLGFHEKFYSLLPTGNFYRVLFFNRIMSSSIAFTDQRISSRFLENEHTNNTPLEIVFIALKFARNFTVAQTFFLMNVSNTVCTLLQYIESICSFFVPMSVFVVCFLKWTLGFGEKTLLLHFNFYLHRPSNVVLVEAMTPKIKFYSVRKWD